MRQNRVPHRLVLRGFTWPVTSPFHRFEDEMLAIENL